MNENRFSRWIAISLLAILVHVSCSFFRFADFYPTVAH